MSVSTVLSPQTIVGRLHDLEQKDLWITPQCQGLINKFPSGLIFSENKLSTDGR